MGNADRGSGLGPKTRLPRRTIPSETSARRPRPNLLDHKARPEQKQSAWSWGNQTEGNAPGDQREGEQRFEDLRKRRETSRPSAPADEHPSGGGSARGKHARHQQNLPLQGAS